MGCLGSHHAVSATQNSHRVAWKHLGPSEVGEATELNNRIKDCHAVSSSIQEFGWYSVRTGVLTALVYTGTRAPINAATDSRAAAGRNRGNAKAWWIEWITTNEVR